jgi:hypothetical protein
MGVTASQNDVAGSEGGGTSPAGGGVEPSRLEGPTRHVMVGQVGDTCVSCEAPLASDQRYCLNCGERRGRSRFSAAATAAQTDPPPAGQAADAPPSQRRRVASGTALIAGIATLLLAMGVGVEIGRISNRNNSGSPTPAHASAPSVQVVTVGSGGGATTASSAPSTSNSTTKAKVKGSQPRTTASKVVVTKKVAAKATQAASKVLGSSAKNLAPPTVKSGQSCSSGAGCQNGKFTGNFFGQ